MKRLLLFLIIISKAVSAQIPNSSFERWIDFGEYKFPSGWHCTNQSTGLQLLKATGDAQEGLTAIRIENIANEKGEVIRGVLQSGTSSNPYFPVSGRPDALQGWMKFDPEVADACYVLIQLTHFNSSLQQRELVGEGLFTTREEINEYQMFYVPIIYFSSIDPDSAVITTYSGMYDGAQAGSCLYLDELSFIGLTNGVTNNASVSTLKVYPNPATSFLKVEVPAEFFEMRLQIFDLIGNVKKSLELNDASSIIDIRALPEGRYFYRITATDKLERLTGSFVIKR